MNLIDILFFIFLLLVLIVVCIIIFLRKSVTISLLVYAVSMILIYFINYLIFGIFNINYLNSNDNILKRIINISIGLFPILILGLILSVILGENEKMNNISKLSNMEKIKETVNKFLVNIKK